MEQLSGFDNLLLFEERGNVFSHVTGLGFYDPGTVAAGRLRFRAMLDHFEKKLASAPVFRRRLAPVPHGLDRPYWINEAEVDVEYHVRHIALPKPGDWRQLMIQVARIHSRPLDQGKPLWEVYLIEGLENIPHLPPDAFAAVFKFHAAGMAGQPIAQAIRGLHATSPRGEREAEPHALTADRELPVVELYAHALAHHLRRGARLSRQALRGGFRLGRELFERIWKDPRTAATPSAAPRAPYTRFNAALSSARVVEAVTLPLADFAPVRARVPQADTMALFLAVLGGALRLYLRNLEELPQAALAALIPLALREPGHAARIGPSPVGLPVALGTELRDPLQRLRTIHAASQSVRHGAWTEWARQWAPELIDDLPAALSELAVRQWLLPRANCIGAQVDGPQTPLYLAGAEAIGFFPIGRPVDGVALNVSSYTYRDQLWIGIGACRQALPDPAFFADCLRAAAAELIAAAARPAKAKPALRRAQAAQRKAA